MAPVAGALQQVGGKIAQSAFGKLVKKAATNVASKITSSKAVTGIKQSVSNLKTKANNYFKGTPTGTTPSVTTASAATNVSTAAKVVKDTATAVTKAGDAAKAAKTAADVKRANVLKGLMTAASVGVGYYQVKSANNQYKDSVKRADAYNAALKAEDAATTAAKNKMNEEYNARADAYTLALATTQTSTQNIYSSGYSGDTIFSSSLIQPKYKIV